MIHVTAILHAIVNFEYGLDSFAKHGLDAKCFTHLCFLFQQKNCSEGISLIERTILLVRVCDA